MKGISHNFKLKVGHIVSSFIFSASHIIYVWVKAARLTLPLTFFVYHSLSLHHSYLSLTLCCQLASKASTTDQVQEKSGDSKLITFHLR